MRYSNARGPQLQCDREKVAQDFLSAEKQVEPVHCILRLRCFSKLTPHLALGEPRAPCFMTLR